MQDMYSSRTKIEPSATLKVAAKARELTTKGVDVIELGGGEPDSPTPAHVADTAMDAMRKGMTKCTPSGAMDRIEDFCKVG
jgi:aspartate aminotransferase